MSKQLERNFLRPTQISKHLYCSICTDVFLEPMRLFCGHTFCNKCIVHWGKENRSCPVCRTSIENNLTGKDLIAEKIIQDLEVSCVYKLCDWKDRLENLAKHAKSCAFSKTPEWLSQVQSSIQVEGNQPVGDIYLQADDHFIERVNEEVSKKSLLERLYTKNAESQKLVKSVFNNKKRTSKKKDDREPLLKLDSFADYQNFICQLGSSDEEESKQTESNELLTLGESSKKESTKSNIAEQTENMAIDKAEYSSTKASLEKSDSIMSASKAKENTIDEIDEIEGIDYTTPQRTKSGKRRSTRRLKSEPNLIKKAKSSAI